MRISISHNRPKEKIIQAVDRTFSDLFAGTGLPVRLANQQKSWQGSTLTFSMAATMGFISTPIKGTVEVTDTEIKIDVDLGALERMVPAKTAQDLITNRIRGLLK